MTKPIAEMCASEFDDYFDVGGDVSELFTAPDAVVESPNRVPGQTRRVNVDFPAWMVEALDAEAERLAVPRQAVIKTLVDDGLARRARAREHAAA